MDIKTVNETINSRELAPAQLPEALGKVVIEHLKKYRVVTLFINEIGEIEWAPHWEARLDHLSQEHFVQKLIELGYTDAQLERALEARETRLAIVCR